MQVVVTAPTGRHIRGGAPHGTVILGTLLPRHLQHQEPCATHPLGKSRSSSCVHRRHHREPRWPTTGNRRHGRPCPHPHVAQSRYAAGRNDASGEDQLNRSGCAKHLPTRRGLPGKPATPCSVSATQTYQQSRNTLMGKTNTITVCRSRKSCLSFSSATTLSMTSGTSGRDGKVSPRWGLAPSDPTPGASAPGYYRSPLRGWPPSPLHASRHTLTRFEPIRWYDDRHA